MKRGRIPRRVKRSWLYYVGSPRTMRRWKLVRRYYLRLSEAVKRHDAIAAAAQRERD